MTPPLPLKPSKILLAKAPGLELDVLKSIASDVSGVWMEEIRRLTSWATQKKGRILSSEILEKRLIGILS